jgi:hypothetical protein
MQYWESEADDGLILYSDPCHPYKIKIAPIPVNPRFSPRRRQHIVYEPEANIPVIHHSGPACSIIHGIADGL